MARGRRSRYEIPVDPRPVGSVAWASAPPDLPVHRFDEPHSPGYNHTEGGVRIMDVQIPGHYRGANTWAQREQYDAMQRRKGYGPEED